MKIIDIFSANTWYFIFLIFLLSLQSNYAQTALPKNVESLFDSVKIIYGNPCSVGIRSSLMDKLAEYIKFQQIKLYLNSYNAVRDTINNFRLKYFRDIQNEPALLLNISLIFKNKFNQNVPNLCGIYYGADSVNNLIVSYTIVHNNILNYYIGVLQVANFDRTFRSELYKNGKDWYYSEKLKGLIRRKENIRNSFDSTLQKRG